MGTLYFSGIEKAATAEVLIKCQAAGMMSWLEYSPNLLSACKDMPLVFDCGAFSRELAREDIEQYARLIGQLADRCIWYANADKIGDQRQSNENYHFLLSLLPPSLHDRVLWIYQYGSDLSYLYEGLRQHQRIGIGGLVPLIQADQQKAKLAILELAAIIRQFDCLPHFFGLSVYSVIQALHEYLPDFTIDSTTWIIGGKYGLKINSQGQQSPANEGGYEWDTESILKQNVRVMSKWLDRPTWASRPVKRTKARPYVQLDFTTIQEEGVA